MPRPLRLSAGNGLIILIVAVLLLWRLLLYLNTPLYGLDPVWYLSQTYSLLRGDLLSSPFGHSFIDPYLLPYMYSVLSAPFFALLGHLPVSLTLWNLFLIAGIAVMVLHLCREFGITDTLLRLVLTLGFAASSYLYGPRPEVLSIFLALVMLYLAAPVRHAKSVSVLRLTAIGGLAAIIGLIQPVGGVFAVFLIGMFGVWHRLPARFFIISLLTTGVTVLLLYLPVVLVNPETWFYDFFTRFREGDTRGRIDVLLFVKYAVYTPFIFVPFILSAAGLLRDGKRYKAVLSITGILLLIVLFTPFSRSYYYPYITVYIVWMVMESGITLLPAALNRLILAGLAIAMPLLSHYYPTIQQMENPAYGVQARTLTTALDTLIEQKPPGIVWVSGNIGMHAIQSPDARLFFFYIARFSGERIQLTPQDVIYMSTDPLRSFLLENVAHSIDDLQITPIIPPISEGLITVEFPEIARSAPIGLWEVQLKP